MDLTALDPVLLAKLQTGGYLLMFGLMVVEGPIVTIISAFLALTGMFDIWIVAMLGWFGDLVGDFLFYAVGRYGLDIFTKKTAIDTPAEENFIEKLDALIHKNLALAIIIIKFTPYAPPIGLAYIGKIRVPLRKYLLTSFFLCIPIPISAAFIGYHIGYINELLLKHPLSAIWPYIFFVIVFFLFIASGFYYLHRQSRSILGGDPHLRPQKTQKKMK